MSAQHMRALSKAADLCREMRSDVCAEACSRAGEAISESERTVESLRALLREQNDNANWCSHLLDSHSTPDEYYVAEAGQCHAAIAATHTKIMAALSAAPLTVAPPRDNHNGEAVCAPSPGSHLRQEIPGAGADRLATPTVAPPRDVIARQLDAHDMHEFYCGMLRRLAHAAASYRTVFPATVTNRVTEDAADELNDALAEVQSYLNDPAAAPQGEATPPREGEQWSAEYVWYRGSFYKRTDERPEASYESPEAIGFLRSLDQGET